MVAPRGELGLAPNASEDDLPCQGQLDKYRACDGFRALKRCRDCMFHREPARRITSPLELPCKATPREGGEAACAHYRKAERRSRLPVAR